MSLIVRQIGGTAVVGAAARVFTVAIPFVVARVYGLGLDTDSFFLAAAVILFWTNSVNPVLETGIISEFATDPGPAGWSRIVRVGVRFSALAIFVGAVAILALTVIPERFLNPVFAGRTRQILLELSPLLILGIWSSLLSGWLNARGQFRSAALSPLFLGFFALGGLFVLTPYLGVHALVLGYLVGEMARLAYLGGRVFRTHSRHGPSRAAEPAPPTTDNGGRFDAMTLQWLCLVLIGLNPVVDRFLAGTLALGSVTVFELTERLTLIPAGIVTWAALPVVTAHFARQAKLAGQAPPALRQIMLWTLAIGCALALAFALVHEWLLPAMFASEQSAWPTYGNDTFLLFLAGLPFHLCWLVLWRLSVIMKQPARIFVLVGVSAFAVNLIVDLAAMRLWGVPGLAFATLLTYTMICAILWRAGGKKVR